MSTQHQTAKQIRALNRLYRMLSSINQMIIQRHEPKLVLDEVCQVAVREGGFCMAWIGIVFPHSTQVRVMTHAGQVGDYLDKVAVNLIGPRSEGATGAALRLGQTVVSNNIAADPNMTLWRESALANGYRASIALPLIVRGTVRAALNLYASSVDFFDEPAIRVLEELATNIGYALEIAEIDQEHVRTERELRDSQMRFQRTLEQAPFPVMLYAEDGEVLGLSETWVEITGYAQRDLPTLADWISCAWGGRSPMPAADGELFWRMDGEHQITCRDGVQRDWAFSSVVVGQATDGRQIIITMAADVTERNWAMTALHQREQQYRQLFDANPHPMWVVDSETLQFLAVNAQAIQHYQFSKDEFLTMELAALYQPDPNAQLFSTTHRAKKLDLSGVWQHRKKDGTVIDVEITAHSLEFAGRPAQLALIDDITERLRTEETLRLDAIVFANTHEGVIITDAEQRILRVNRGFSDLTGYSASEVLGKTPHLLSSNRQDQNFYREMWDTLHEQGYWQGELWNKCKDGALYPGLLNVSAVKNSQGIVTHYVGVFADLSQLKASEDRIDFLAHYDPLTKLPNRLFLSARLQHSIEISNRNNSILALLVLDLDRFRDVNDSYGHSAGDALLQQVAERLLLRLRNADTIIRLGGDEFAVLLEDLAEARDAAHVAMDIINLLNQPWQLMNGAEVRLGASIGISLYPEHGQNAEDLLRQADSAVNRAKQEGRGRFQYFSAELTEAACQRIDLEGRLRRAIEANQLRVYYQPKLEMHSGRIIGAEALVRWQDPDRGLISPALFIPIAEETGLISAVGNWVLLESCRQGQLWLEAGLPPLDIAVNISAHQLHRGNVVMTVIEILRDTGFPAQHLTLELTESALMHDEIEAVSILERLRRLGLSLAMDDFGTGYSSLAYLKRFPLDMLKIDKSFVDDLPRQQDAMEIAATIIAIGHILGLKVLAEGVETVEQLEFLQSKGCDQYQGYLVSPPVPADKFEALLMKNWQEIPHFTQH